MIRRWHQNSRCHSSQQLKCHAHSNTWRKQNDSKHICTLFWSAFVGRTKLSTTQLKGVWKSFQILKCKGKPRNHCWESTHNFQLRKNENKAKTREKKKAIQKHKKIGEPTLFSGIISANILRILYRGVFLYVNYKCVHVMIG